MTVEVHQRIHFFRSWLNKPKASVRLEHKRLPSRDYIVTFVRFLSSGRLSLCSNLVAIEQPRVCYYEPDNLQASCCTSIVERYFRSNLYQVVSLIVQTPSQRSIAHFDFGSYIRLSFIKGLSYSSCFASKKLLNMLKILSISLPYFHETL